MGFIGRKLAGRLDRNTRALLDLRRQIREAQARTDWTPDPVHSAYVCVQNLTSIFAEAVSPMHELRPYYDLAASAEDEYMPSGPPMSPLTVSYFTAWAFFDLRFGRDFETIGSILLDVGKSLGLSPLNIAVARQFQQSRMGIYELCGTDTDRCRLRELITNDEFSCVVPSGYPGRVGELWYVRLCPPIAGYDYHVAFTTPYILQNTSQADWVAYLERSLDTLTGHDLRSKLFQLLKYGRHTNGWNEFIFQGYAGCESSAVFLTGLPDVPKSLPHADTTGKRRCG